MFQLRKLYIKYLSIRLHVHLLPVNQRICFVEGGEQAALDRATQRDTHLTAWFKLDAENEEPQRYPYVEIRYHFVFDSKRCKWKIWQRGNNKVIVRMYKVSPTDESFFS